MRQFFAVDEENCSSVANSKQAEKEEKVEAKNGGKDIRSFGSSSRHVNEESVIVIIVDVFDHGKKVQCRRWITE